MKQYTQEEFNNFARDEFGYLQCPPGDYRLIKIFPEMCSFGECCSFGEYGNILVRCGCFCGMIDDFAKRVEEEHRDDVHGEMYRLAIEMARVKAGSLS